MVLTRFKLIVQIGAVISIAGTAGWLLYTDLDPDLSTVAFKKPVVTQTAANHTAPVPTRTTTHSTTNTVVELEPAIPDETTSSVVTKVTRAELRSASTTAARTPITIQIIGPSVNVSCAVEATGTTTVQAVMQQASEQCGFSYSGENYGGLGFFVEEIAGLTQNQQTGYYWIFSVNAQISSLGVSSQEVAAGDSIQWHYQAEY